MTNTTAAVWQPNRLARYAFFALMAFIVLLPFHSLILTILLAQIKIGFGAVRAVAAWKEALLGVSVALAVGSLLYRVFIRKEKIHWIGMDLIVLIWVALVLLYLLLQNRIVGDFGISLSARLYGARDWLLYIAPFLVGRLLPFGESKIARALNAIAWVGVITCGIGLIERFFIPTEWHVKLGVPIYFRDFLNTEVLSYLQDMPSNYWAETNSKEITRRAVSVYLSGQGFALPFLVIMPVITYRLFSRITLWRALTFVICIAGLLANLTRMTIFAAAVEILIVLLLMRQWKLLIVLAIVGAIGAAGAYVGSSTVRTFVNRTISCSESSCNQRDEQWMDGIRRVQAKPFGYGLGYGGQAGLRNESKGVVELPGGKKGIGEEAGYFKLTTDLGVPGLAIFVAWFAGVLWCAFSIYRKSSGMWRGLAIIVFAIACGFLINNLTAPPDQSPFVMYVFPWLAGLIASQRATL